MKKPEYRVPLMREIAEREPSGLTVASTFSGCGGSSLGYRMAGFHTVWANEFDNHAADCYEANSRLSVDRRDIRQVAVEDLLDVAGMDVGELDLLDGSPPCQGFSTAGTRQVNDPRNTLFGEYARLLAGLRPKCFVAENVSGLAKGLMKGTFKAVFRMLEDCGYRVACRLLDAQWLRVPQMRQRTIFVGVREDLGIDPAYPKPLGYRYSVRDALPWILETVNDPRGLFPPQHNNGTKPQCSITVRNVNHIRATSAVEVISGNDGFNPKWGRIESAIYPTIMAHGPHGGSGELRQGTERRKFTIAELKRICSFPDDFVLNGSYAKQWARLGNSVPPLMMWRIATVVKEQCLGVTRGGLPLPERQVEADGEDTGRQAGAGDEAAGSPGYGWRKARGERGRPARKAGRRHKVGQTGSVRPRLLLARVPEALEVAEDQACVLAGESGIQSEEGRQGHEGAPEGRLVRGRRLGARH